MSLFEAEKIEFNKNGFIHIKNFYDVDVINEIKNKFIQFNSWDTIRDGDLVLDKANDGNQYPLKYLQYVNYYVPEFNRLLSSQVLNIASYFFDQEVYYEMIEIHNKEPNGGTRTPPHQDNFYFCLDPSDACTVYVPLEAHGPHNGGLHFIAGSHLEETLHHESSKIKAFSSGIDLTDEQLKSEKVIPINANPGDILIHHCKTIHFTYDNNSKESRLSASIRINGVNAKKNEALLNKYLVNKKINRA